MYFRLALSLYLVLLAKKKKTTLSRKIGNFLFLKFYGNVNVKLLAVLINFAL